LGAQRADVGSIRAIWAIQDRIALSGDEEKSIGLKREVVNGREIILWDQDRGLEPKVLEFTETEIARIKSAIETWSAFSACDRPWLEPLLQQLYFGQ